MKRPNIEAIRARCEAATDEQLSWSSASWSAVGQGEDGFRPFSPRVPVARGWGTNEEQCRYFVEADRAFYTHARIDIPALLDYAEELEHAVYAAHLADRDTKGDPPCYCPVCAAVRLRVLMRELREAP